MTRRDLFRALCEVANALEEEAQRFPLTAHACVLLGLVAALDRVINSVMDAPDARAWRWMDDEPGP
jgi:hypothetical protein